MRDQRRGTEARRGGRGIAGRAKMTLTVLTCWLVLTGAVVSGVGATAGSGALGSGARDAPTGATASGQSSRTSAASLPSAVRHALQANPNVNTSNDSFGWSVASAGDFNGDGATDVIVGAPGRGSNNTGGAYVFYGPIDAANISLSSADLVLYGESPGDHAGWSVDGGDVDGDGYSDIVVGAPYNDDGGGNAGATYVVYGREKLRGTIPLGGANAKLVGEPGSQAGFSVNARDVDDADAPGLVVGAPATGNDRPGSASLVAAASLSNDTSTLLSTATRPLNASAARVVSSASDDRAGWSVAWTGDLDDDGTAEAAVGAPFRNRSGDAHVGAIYLVGADASGSITLNDTEAAVTGGAAADNLGFAVAGAGDVNGDGVADLLAGAPGNDTRGRNAGAAYVLFGGSSANGTRSVRSADVSVFGEAAGDRLGWAVTGAGDVDCDGRDDVVVGAPAHGDSGTAYVIYGRATDETAGAAKLVGRDSGDFTGASVAGFDHADDNGTDILVGAPGSDAAGPDSGAVYLLRPNQCGASRGNAGDRTGTARDGPGGGSTRDFRRPGTPIATRPRGLSA